MLKSRLLNWLKSVILRLRKWKSRAALTLPRPALVPKLHSHEERSRRGAEAAQLLENPLLREAFSNFEADVVRQMYQVKLDDEKAHTRLILALQTGRSVGRYLWTVIQDGASANQEVQLRGKRID